MINQTYQEREEAVAKWQRAQLSSCQLDMYYAGYKGWEEVRVALPAAQSAGFFTEEFSRARARRGRGPALDA